MSRRWRLAVSLMLLLLPFVVYAPAVSGTKVWDDYFLVGVNPFFRSPALLLESFRHWLFIDSAAPYYRPVQNWSYFADYWLWRDWLPGYHLSSIFIHALAGILWWKLARLLTRDQGLSGVKWDVVTALAALVWTIHPAHNAAVAYISGRADPLAAFFALSAWLVFRSGEGRRRKILTTGLAAVLGLAALCSRESGMIWLGLFVCYEGFVRKKIRADVVIGAVVLAGVYACLRNLPEGIQEKSASGREMLPAIWKSFLAVGDYAGMLLAPFRLSMERSLVAVGETGWELVPSALGLLIFSGWLCYKPGPSRKLRCFLVVAFFGAMLPILPLLSKNADSAEHWMYIPSMLLFLAGMCLLGETTFPIGAVSDDEEDAPPQSKVFHWTMALILAWASLLGARTVVRALDWKDHQAFLSATIRNGAATDRIRGVLAAEFAQQGKFEETDKILRETIARNPENVLMRIPLGKSLEQQGRLEEALEYLDLEQIQDLRKRHPLYVEAPIHQASVLWKLGRQEEAISVLQKAEGLWPGNWSVYSALGNLLQSAGRKKESIVTVQKFLERCPWDLRPWQSLAILQMEEGNYPEAAMAWKQAVRLDIHRADTLVGLARAELALGNREEALVALGRAAAREPDNAGLWRMLGEMQSRESP